MPDDTPHARGDWRPIPDPTVLTTEQLNRGLAAEREYIDGRINVLIERLAGMDRATELLATTLDRSLSGKVDDLKVRVTAIEALRLGAQESTTARQASISVTAGVFVALFAFISIIVAIAVATHGFSK